jgi:hypothetical protein
MSYFFFLPRISTDMLMLTFDWTLAGGRANGSGRSRRRTISEYRTTFLWLMLLMNPCMWSSTAALHTCMHLPADLYLCLICGQPYSPWFVDVHCQIQGPQSHAWDEKAAKRGWCHDIGSYATFYNVAICSTFMIWSLQKWRWACFMEWVQLLSFGWSRVTCMGWLQFGLFVF